MILKIQSLEYFVEAKEESAFRDVRNPSQDKIGHFLSLIS